jgi:hypothetical protein
MNINLLSVLLLFTMVGCDNATNKSKELNQSQGINIKFDSIVDEKQDKQDTITIDNLIDTLQTREDDTAFAEFSTDKTRLRRFYRNNDGQLPKHIKEQFWFINGQKMSYSSGPIKVKVGPDKLDTILFKGYRQKEFDTIICNISEAKKFKFYYNECCGGLNIKDELTQKFIRGRISIKLKHPSNKVYLGLLGQSGSLITVNSSILSEGCRSAMSPNVYNVVLKQIGPCVDSTNCEEVCIMGKTEMNYGYEYKTLITKLHFLFMPLDNEPLVITYDPKSDLIVIK